MNFIKKTIVTLITIFLALTIFGYIFFKSINPETVKQIISQKISAISKQDVSINGEIHWQLFPMPHLNITNIEINGVNHSTQMKLDNIQLNLLVSALFHGQIYFDEIKINGLHVQLDLDKKSPNPTNIPQNKIKKTSEKNSNITFAIHNFLLNDGQLTLLSNSNKVKLNNIQLQFSDLNTENTEFPIQFKLNIMASLASNPLNTSLNYHGRIKLSPSTLNDLDNIYKNIVLKGQLVAKDFIFNQFKIERLTADTVLQNANLNLNPINLSLYHGQSIGDVSYSFNTNKITINQTASNLNGQNLFKDLTGRDLFKGNLNVSIRASTLLSNAWQNSLSGDGHLSIKDGSLRFVDLNQLISDLINNISDLITKKDLNIGKSLSLISSSTSGQGETKFKGLTIQYHLTGPKLINDNTLLQTDKLELQGNSTLNLNDTSLSGSMKIKVQTNDQKINHIQEMLGGSFPFQITGTYHLPIVLPSSKVINTLLINYLMSDKLQKPINEFKNQLLDKVIKSKNVH